MHVCSELKSQHGYPKLLLVLKMQANKHFDHLSVSFFEWPKISVGCNPPFLLCLISSTFLHSGYFLSWLVISFPMPNLVPQLLLPWLLDFFLCCPHLALCIFHKPCKYFAWQCTCPCSPAALFSTAATFTYPSCDWQKGCCWDGAAELLGKDNLPLHVVTQS